MVREVVRSRRERKAGREGGREEGRKEGRKASEVSVGWMDGWMHEKPKRKKRDWFGKREQTAPVPFLFFSELISTQARQRP